MGDNAQPNEPPQRWPLQWAAGYFISHDGILSRADGRALKQISLQQAQHYCESNSPHDALVSDCGGVQTVFCVRLVSDVASAEVDASGTPYRRIVLPMKASGDISSHWYFVSADDGARWVLHGPSYAHNLSARQ